MVSRISLCQTIMQWQWLLFLDMQILGSDLELATVIEIRCHWAAGYSATAHNKAFFTRLMKSSYITALSTSWDTPSRLPVERYQAASTDAATWPSRDAFRNCWKAAVCGSCGKYISSLITHRISDKTNVQGSNLVPPRHVRVVPTQVINSQVKHGIVTPIQSSLFKVFHSVFIVFQYNPVVPAQTIQGVNWTLKQGYRCWYSEGRYWHTDWLLGVCTRTIAAALSSSWKPRV